MQSYKSYPSQRNLSHATRPLQGCLLLRDTEISGARPVLVVVANPPRFAVGIAPAVGLVVDIGRVTVGHAPVELGPNRVGELAPLRAEALIEGQVRAVVVRVAPMLVTSLDIHGRKGLREAGQGHGEGENAGEMHSFEEDCLVRLVVVKDKL